METTFMTIHNLSADANIMFASESIVYILGYQPDEIVGRSCFEYFHPDEIPFARKVHSRGVMLDKAAVLHYARIRGRDGQWVGCECVFTIVHDVLVASTSIYRGDVKNERRAAEAPVIRRLFASSPRDPRYHMLEHLSPKFKTPPDASLREPRAALILNRFTRTLTVMYATNAVSTILGITPAQFVDKSFYECIQENCLPEAIRCLESAKSNDSIAYLRFWYRDPRREEDMDQEDQQMREGSQSSDEEGGGVALHMDIDQVPPAEGGSSSQTGNSSSAGHHQKTGDMSRTSSDESTDLENNSPAAIFDHSGPSQSSSSSSAILLSPDDRRRVRPAPAAPRRPEPFELEAVISCTSDGLVVILRRARPIIPQLRRMLPPVQAFAPWGVNPIWPNQHNPDVRYPFNQGVQALQQAVGGGPDLDDFMGVIRNLGVFAWSITGINGNLFESRTQAIPRGEALPPGGLPIWDPYAAPRPIASPPENQAAARWGRERHNERTNEPARGNDIPFLHPQEEERIRDQSGIQEGPMGSDRAGSSANAYLENYTHHMSLNSQHSQQAPPYGDAVNHFGTQAQAPAPGDSGTMNPGLNAYTSPEDQKNEPPSGEGRSSRNLWY